MNVRQMFKLLLALFVTAGLTVAPLATPAAAGPATHAKMMQMAGMSDAAADMPCCPGKQDNDHCDCPLFGICAIKSPQMGPSIAATVVERTAVHAVLFSGDDAIADGLERPPPDHPPRSLV